MVGNAAGASRNRSTEENSIAYYYRLNITLITAVSKTEVLLRLIEMNLPDNFFQSDYAIMLSSVTPVYSFAQAGEPYPDEKVINREIVGKIQSYVRTADQEIKDKKSFKSELFKMQITSIKDELSNMGDRCNGLLLKWGYV